MTQPEKANLSPILANSDYGDCESWSRVFLLGGGGRDQQNQNKEHNKNPQMIMNISAFGSNKLNQIPQRLKYQRYAHSSCSDILIKCT